METAGSSRRAPLARAESTPVLGGPFKMSQEVQLQHFPPLTGSEEVTSSRELGVQDQNRDEDEVIQNQTQRLHQEKQQQTWSTGRCHAGDASKEARSLPRQAFLGFRGIGSGESSNNRRVLGDGRSGGEINTGSTASLCQSQSEVATNKDDDPGSSSSACEGVNGEAFVGWSSQLSRSSLNSEARKPRHISFLGLQRSAGEFSSQPQQRILHPVFLKVRVPAVGGTKTVKFDAGETVGSAIAQLATRLPDAHKSAQLGLYLLPSDSGADFPEGRRLDANFTLRQCGLLNLQQVVLKREPVYVVWRRTDFDARQRDEERFAALSQLAAVDGGGFKTLRQSFRKTPILLPHDIRTGDAIVSLSKWIAPPQIGRGGDDVALNENGIDPLQVYTGSGYVPGIRAFKQHPITGSKQELRERELPLLSAYGLKAGDTLLLEQVESGELVECVIEYSPLLTEQSPINVGTPLRANDSTSLDAYSSAVRALSFDDLPRAEHNSGRATWGRQAIARKFGYAVQATRRVLPLASDAVERIGSPTNVVHRTHVDFDFQWSGSEKPEDVFELGQRLGVGSWGSVFVAKHRESGFKVACKVVTANAKARLVLAQEIETLKKCSNSSVLSYFGTVLTNDSVWILTELCAYGSVKDVMEVTQEELSDLQIAFVLFGTLKGLAYLHAQKLVHLDVKSANIMVTEQADVKLGDFGVTEQLRRNQTHAQKKTFVGSPLFMAPEVIRMDGYNDRADVWSLGITVIEMATGSPPNSDITTIAQMEELLRRVSETPPTLPVGKRKFDQLLHDFLEQCFVVDPESRPRSVELIGHEFVATAIGLTGRQVFASILAEYEGLQAGAEKRAEQARMEALIDQM